MRKSSALILYVALNVTMLAMLAMHARYQQDHQSGPLGLRANLAAALQLTDLCLFTEARYTRHPSQADYHTAFQDHPFSLEHFPSGSLVPPGRSGREP
jgi:hypothetical protein